MGQPGDPRSVIDTLTLDNSASESYTKHLDYAGTWWVDERVNKATQQTRYALEYTLDRDGTNDYHLTSSGHDSAGTFLLDTFRLTGSGTESLTYSQLAEKQFGDGSAEIEDQERDANNKR